MIQENIMIINFLFRVLLTFNATSLLAIIFFVQKKYTLYYFFQRFEHSHWLSLLPQMTSYVFYMLIPILLTWISLLLSSRLGKDEFKEGEVVSVEHANNSFLPSYLGYFFVALSITSWSALFFFMPFYLFLPLCLKHYTLTLYFYCLDMSFITLKTRAAHPFF